MSGAVRAADPKEPEIPAAPREPVPEPRPEITTPPPPPPPRAPPPERPGAPGQPEISPPL